MGSSTSRKTAAAAKSRLPAAEPVTVKRDGNASVRKAGDREETVSAPGQDGQSWRDLLMALSKQDPWDGQPREHRAHWENLLEEARLVVRTPRRKLREDVTMRALRGDPLPSHDRRSHVTIFISSTFTDTQAERNLLMRDVYPYLRTLCRLLDLDFGTVDMRWGVKEELTMEHGTTKMCISEVNRCVRESAGPAFLALLCHKYGYRALPVGIDQKEFDKLMSLLSEMAENTTTIRAFYELDTNSLPPEYVLQPRRADDSDWWSREKQVIALFRKVASQLDAVDAEKYFISITEKEVKSGFLSNPHHKDQVVCLTRELSHVTEKRHLHRHIIDMTDGAVDDDAQKYLTELKTEKIKHAAATGDVILEFVYEKDEESACREYVVDCCDQICEKIVRGILDSYKEYHHIEHDPIYEEVIQHQKFALQKREVFVGRDDLIQSITTKVSHFISEESKVICVYGMSGSGKTALMAVVANEIKDKVLPTATVVIRFLGTTSRSGSALAVLHSVCVQLTRVYGKNPNAIPSSYSDLIGYFREALSFGTESQPIVIFLDSLDQLSNEDFGQNLKWLSLQENLPPHAQVVVSTIPCGCLDALKAYIPENHLEHVPNMTPEDGPLLMDQMLGIKGRTVTASQRQIILDAFAKCPLPLFLRLVVDIALKWHSYDDILADAVADDMPGLINLQFQYLESHFGTLFVQHALAYVTCARDGLSVSELEDILSCDDDVLDYLFDFWLPPFRRVPQLLWIRVRNELGMYLMERGTNGVNAYGWYHRQFWETAAARYLDNENGFREQAHMACADYFEGKWTDGKLWTPKAVTRAVTDLTPRMEKRQVPPQPISLSGTRGLDRQLNNRKLAELPYHLLALQDWDRFEQQIANLEFVEAKFEAGQGYECRSTFLQAAEQSGRPLIRAMSKFIGLGLVHFLAEPISIHQVAGQQVKGNPVRALFDGLSDATKQQMTRKFSRSMAEGEVDDPCEMTLRGHTSGIRCVRFNPKGHVIASAAEDGSVRLWDVFSGAEVVTVTGLPGPRYVGLAGSYAGERPCVWDRAGSRIIAGSEDGGIQVFDINGAEVKAWKPHTAAVTMVAVSPDNTQLIACSKDHSLSVYGLADLSPITVVSLDHNPLGCDYSPDGAWVAVSMQNKAKGLVMVRTSDWAIQFTGSGNANLNFCVVFSPRGSEIVTGGDDSSITVWSPGDGQMESIIRGHRGWIWGMEYNASGTRLLSGSSDRTCKLWDMDKHVCLVTIGGHMHRVTWACFRPGVEDKFVTSSYDMSLKVWDYEAVATGRLPPTGGMHYTILESSPCAQYIATCQGWGKQCTLFSAASRETLGSSPAHTYFLLEVCFTPNSKFFVTLDTGYNGEWSEDAEMNALVKVSEVPTGDELFTLDVRGPVSIAAGHKYFVVGTKENQVCLFEAENKVHTWMAGNQKGEQGIRFVAISYTDDVIASSNTSEGITVWRIGSAGSALQTTVAHRLPFDDPIRELRFSPNGRHLVAADRQGHIHVWDAAGGKFEQTCILRDHVGKINHIAFSKGSADGFMVSAGVDMTMRTWAVHARFSLHSVFYGPINQVGFVQDDVVAVGEATGNMKYIKIDM